MRNKEKKRKDDSHYTNDISFMSAKERSTISIIFIEITIMVLVK